jgi:hypothetical protein
MNKIYNTSKNSRIFKHNGKIYTDEEIDYIYKIFSRASNSNDVKVVNEIDI